MDLIGLIVELNIHEDALDESVHEQKASEAASINNGGFEAQIVYLVEQMGKEAVEELLREVAGSPPLSRVDLYYIDEDQVRHFLGAVTGKFSNYHEAEQAALAEHWDTRLEAAGCRPAYTVTVIKDPTGTEDGD